MDKEKNKIVRVPIIFPRLFNIYPSGAKPSKGKDGIVLTYRTLDKIAKAVLLQKKYVLLDMSKCKEITAAAALLLFSEVTRCLNTNTLAYKDLAIEFIWPTDKNVLKLLRRAGFIKATKPGRKKLEAAWRDKEIAFYSGNNPAKELQNISDMLKKSLNRSTLPKNIERALSEAFLNIVHHAYGVQDGEELHEFIINRWWMYVDIRPHKDNIYEMVFIIYDKGIGMHATTRNYLSAISSSQIEDDEFFFKYAFQSNFSSTGDSLRGLGTEDLKKPLLTSGDTLLIYSGTATLNFTEKCKEPTSATMPHDVGGTLLEWALRFKK